MNTVNNRRIRATDEKIIRAVFEIMILEKKSVGRITVREICEKTGIHRSTFYAHYQDVYDVMEKVEQTMSRRLTESFLVRLNEGASAQECFVSLFSFIYEYRDFYTLYLNETNRAGVIGVAWELFQDRVEQIPYYNINSGNDSELDYHGAFFLFGVTAMVRRWLNGGCRETPQKMFAILKKQSEVEQFMLGW